MEKQLETLQEEIRTSLENIKDNDSLEAVRIKFLGRKGKINRLLKKLQLQNWIS